MSKRRIRKWQWSDSLYAVDYYLYIGPYEGFAHWINELKEDEKFLDPSHDAKGQTVWFWTEEPLTSAVGLFLGDQCNPKDPSHFNTIAHEALHATFSVMQSRGLKPANKSEEAFTYYLGWLVEEMTKRLMK